MNGIDINKHFIPTPKLYASFCKGWNEAMIGQLLERNDLSKDQIEKGNELMRSSGAATKWSGYMKNTSIDPITLQTMIAHQYGFVSIMDGNPENDRIESFFYPFRESVLKEVRDSSVVDVSPMDIVLSWFESQVSNKMIEVLDSAEAKYDPRVNSSNFLIYTKLDMIKTLFAQAHMLVSNLFYYKDASVTDVVPDFNKNSFLTVYSNIDEKINNLKRHHKEIVQRKYSSSHNLFGRMDIMLNIDELVNHKNVRKVNEIESLMSGFQSLIKNEV